MCSSDLMKFTSGWGITGGISRFDILPARADWTWSRFRFSRLNDSDSVADELKWKEGKGAAKL